MKLSDIPIRQKLMLVSLLTSGVIILLTCAAYVTYEVITFRQVTRGQLLTIGRIIAANSTAALAFDNPTDGEEILGALQAEGHIVAAGLYDGKGRLFSRYPDSLSSAVFPVAPQPDGYIFRDTYLLGFQPVIQGQKRLGTLYLKMEMSAMYERLMRYGLIACAVVLLSFLLAYGLSRRLQKVISAPILSLAQTARIVSDQYDYSVRATKSGADELGLLTDAFNHMLGQIDRQNQEITSFNQRLEQKVKERTGELERANEELRVKTDLVETILDSSVHVIAVLDRKLRFTMINKRCEQLYAIDRQFIIGRVYTDVFPQTIGSTAHQSIMKALQGEYVQHTVTGSAVIAGYFETYFIPLVQHDEVYGVLIISHDISEIMETNQKLKLTNDQLVKSNHDLEQFAYVASHDLQEPLRKIRTFTELLKNAPLDEREVHRYLDKVAASAARMTDLIRDVLSYSRLSKSGDCFVETNLMSVVDLVKADFDLLIQEKGATLFYSDLPVIPGVPHQLTQLFTNLIGNALKFCPHEPVIRITARELAAPAAQSYGDLSRERSYWEITIADNGIGFDPLYSQQIFTIFQRLHDKKAYTGTGIGLALCKKIVENHQGYIEASSQPGQGATFTVVLPKAV